MHRLFSCGVLAFAFFACGGGTDAPGTSSPSPAPTSPAPPSTSDPAPPAPTPVPPLPKGVYELSGTAFDAPDTDLEPLKTVLASAEVAAFGETVHTSGGYSSMRARTIKFLVEKMGYRAISFEGPWGRAEATRAYVEDGVGTLKEAMAGLTFLAWRNEGTAGLVEWLKGWNAAHPSDKVRFFGFDIQGPDHDAKLVRDTIARVAPSQQATADGTRKCLGAKYDTFEESFVDPEEKPYLTGTALLPLERHQACLDAVTAIEAYVDANEGAFTTATSAADVELLRLALLSLRANDDQMYFFLRDAPKSYDARDAGMAKVFLRLRALRAPGKKAAIWAHNRHITTKGDELVPAQGDIAWHDTGSYIADALGDKYAAVGLFAHVVAYNWDGTKETQEPPRDEDDALEKPLAALKKPYLLIDLASNGVLPPEKTYEMGSYGGTGVPSKHYRAAIFLERSPAQKAFL